MSMLSDIKVFVKKFIKSPILSIGASYIIYKILSKHNKKEGLCENIKVIQKDKDFEIIYDDVEKVYSVIDGRGVHNDFYPAKDVSEAKKIIKKIRVQKNSYSNKERLNILYESIKSK